MIGELVMKILVDADACPVKDLIVNLVVDGNYQLIMVSSIAHWSDKLDNDLIKYIIVDNIPEAADMKIVNLSEKGDIVVTQDYGLAALLLGKGVKVLSPRGKRFTEQNIDYLLDKRHHSAKLRRGGINTKGPSKYSKSDKKIFESNLRKLLGLS
jgi:hypothetical protein